MSSSRPTRGPRPVAVRALDASLRAARALQHAESLEHTNFVDDGVGIDAIEGLYVEDVGGGGARRAVGGGELQVTLKRGGSGARPSAGAGAGLKRAAPSDAAGGARPNRARRFYDVLTLEVYGDDAMALGAGSGAPGDVAPPPPSVADAVAAAAAAPRASVLRAGAVAAAHWLAAVAPRAAAPARPACSVCGAPKKYSCVRCGDAACSAACGAAHRESRCR